ncbi:MAG: dTDP-4-dehydrorhamnose reductase [Selenomonas sp.]|nr:dTDP-4-dehydrorhamnose reductase [Selenomonadales bacterium]MDD7763054.1 dTDP-4-dehydrorhamnose reductase [Selenomonadales bacterium]MDY5717543.1 dTDP-4-dehydrorhamnose reductase [Selenomonas sp.]
MKVLVTGASGQLGFDCVKELERRHIVVRGVNSKDFPLTDFAVMQQYLLDYKPDAVIHCAAYTAVDKAEEEAAACEAVNVIGTRNLAKLCHEIDAKLLYISTDYVFAGDGDKFYEPQDEKKPQNVYGLSKLKGEQAVAAELEKYFIVRISWVFGINGKNFIRTMLNLSKTHTELNVVNDQIGSPTYTSDLAVLLADIIQSDKYGIYHATNEGTCSWADFAREIFKQARKAVKVNDVPATAYPTKAKRPYNSRLSKACLDKAGFKRLPAWQDAVKRYLQELG